MAENIQGSQPSYNEIFNKFKDADDMMDFIKLNSQPKVPATPQNPIPTQPSQAPVQADLQAEALKEVEVKKAAEKVPPPEEPKAAVKEVTLDTVDYDLNPKDKEEPKNEDENKTASHEEDKPIEGEEANSKEENFKKVRGLLKQKDTELQEKTKVLQELETKVKKYETGEEIPEPAKHLEERVRELEYYEKLHALKLSPAYKEAFVKPSEELKTKLTAIGADYSIPQEVMEQAMNITNKAELNRFLSEHFDDVGALEVKQLINQAQDITLKARQAEQAPAQALDNLNAEYKNLQAHRRAQSNNVIASNSKDAWADSLLKIKQEGKALELIYKDGDSKHNQTYVEPVVRKAASEYGKIVKLLADNGLEQLPKDLAFALARMVQLAHASAIAIETRAAAEKGMEELVQNSSRATRYGRPAIGGGVSSGGVAASKPKNVADAVERLIASVGTK